MQLLETHRNGLATALWLNMNEEKWIRTALECHFSIVKHFLCAFNFSMNTRIDSSGTALRNK